MNDLWVWAHQIWQSVHDGQLPQLGVWSYVLVGLLVATEGPLTTLVAAAAAATGLMDVRLVFIVTMAGNIVGDTLWYGMGYAGKAGLVERAPKWMGATPERVERLEHEMRTHALKLIVFAKIAYGLMVPTLLAAGIARVPWRKWFPVVFVVETAWSAILVWVGFHAAGMLGELERGLRMAGVGALLLMVVAAVWFALRRKQARATPRRGGSASGGTKVVDSGGWVSSAEWKGTLGPPALLTWDVVSREEVAAVENLRPR
jgi:membrane protein DedA with SNARE-associated domain